MAASPKFKIYDASDAYQASCHEIEAAAALMAFYGAGATIRIDHSKKYTVWHEGAETQPAAESYDYVASVAHIKELELQQAAYLAVHGPAKLRA